VLELAHLDDLGEPLDSLHERVLDRLAHGARERHELRRIELLLAEENDLVLEERLPYLLDGRVLRQVDAEQLGAERARDAPDFYCSTLMLASLMIEP
jgi:hypothetical protein